MPDISEGAIEVKVRRYISGQWVEGWAAGSEICNTRTLGMFTAPLGMDTIQCTPAPCAKAEAIKTARELKWSADELCKVLKAVGS